MIRVDNEQITGYLLILIGIFFLQFALLRICLIEEYDPMHEHATPTKIIQTHKDTWRENNHISLHY